MNDIFADPKTSTAAFSGLPNLYKAGKKKYTVAQVKEFLHGQEAYTRHFPLRHVFQRRRVLATAVDSDWQADLCDMKQLSTKNKNYSYLLTVVDVLSKYAWVEPIKKKKPENVAAALGKIIQESGRKPSRLFTDRGKEFVGSVFQDFLRDHEIQHLLAQNDTVKASVAERFNRTLKTRLWKYFTHYQTHRYLDILPHIVNGYNHSYHRSIKMAPAAVNASNEQQVWNTLYGKEKVANVKYKFNVGDLVRIPEKKRGFRKGYEPNFSKDIFVIERRLLGMPPLYKVRNSDGKGHLRSFYETELVKVSNNPVALPPSPPPSPPAARRLRSWTE